MHKKYTAAFQECFELQEICFDIDWTMSTESHAHLNEFVLFLHAVSMEVSFVYQHWHWKPYYIPFIYKFQAFGFLISFQYNVVSFSGINCTTGTTAFVSVLLHCTKKDGTASRWIIKYWWIVLVHRSNSTWPILCATSCHIVNDACYNRGMFT